MKPFSDAWPVFVSGPFKFLLATLAGLSLVLTTAAAQQPRALPVAGDVAFAHDPSIARDGNLYYVFTTGRTPDGGQFAIRCSPDLTHWRLCGHVFNAIPRWIVERSPGTQDLWAPDISFEHGIFRLYYAYSLFGSNISGIALATNKTLDPSSPDYHWIDKGLVLESKATDNFNAIDPNYIEDARGGAWLAFGSFWGGIKMRSLDAATGLLATADTTLHSLATRAKPAGAADGKPGLPPDWEAIEAPFVLAHDGYFYLFVSWDLCCRGTKSTYRTMVGRSRNVTGPYTDESGVPMMQGGGTPELIADKRWLGPGGASVLQGKSDPEDGGRDLLVFHAYDATTGRPSLQVSTIVWRNDWPVSTVQ